MTKKSKTSLKLAGAFLVAFSGAANAATIHKDGVMACPSIQAWADIMASFHSKSGAQGAIRAANDAGCVSVPSGTSVSIVSEVGPLARVIAPNGRPFYFRTQDIR